jgi:chromosome segregation ATPase
MLMEIMKNSIGIIVLLVICLGLGVGLMIVKRNASERHDQDAKQIDTLSNQWTKASSDLEEQKKVAVMLEKDMETKRTDYEKSLADLTNNVTVVSSNLAKAESGLKAAEQQVKEKDAKIADLETQNQALDKKAAELSNSLTNLTAQIAETRRKLATSEGNQAFLEKQLKQLMTEKTELERQFNDITVLRAQVSKLKEEMNIARRLEWSRQGIVAASDQKGAQRLMQGFSATSPKSTRPNYDLNVEVNADGSVRVIPSATNNIAPGNQTPR